MHVVLRVFDVEDEGPNGAFSPKMFHTDTITFAEPHTNPDRCFIHVNAAGYSGEGTISFCCDHSFEEVAELLGAATSHLNDDFTSQPAPSA